jgi:hypothetical protein
MYFQIPFGGQLAPALWPGGKCRALSCNGRCPLAIYLGIIVDSRQLINAEISKDSIELAAR